MWILIIFFMNATQHDGVALTQVEFSSKGACQSALATVKHMNPRIDAVCVDSGE